MHQTVANLTARRRDEPSIELERTLNLLNSPFWKGKHPGTRKGDKVSLTIIIFRMSLDLLLINMACDEVCCCCNIFKQPDK